MDTQEQAQEQTQGVTLEDMPTAAVKLDGGKVRTHLFPIRAHLIACQVFNYGADKYAEGNWFQGGGFHWSRLLSAGDRHRKAFQLGQHFDPESKLHHLGHAICCDAMLLEHVMTGHGVDDRFKGQIAHFSDDEIRELLLNGLKAPAE